MHNFSGFDTVIGGILLGLPKLRNLVSLDSDLWFEPQDTRDLSCGMAAVLYQSSLLTCDLGKGTGHISIPLVA